MIGKQDRNGGRRRFGAAMFVMGLMLSVLPTSYSGAAIGQGTTLDNSVNTAPEAIRLVSIDWDGNPGDANSWLPSISTDGRRIAFISSATNLGQVFDDTNITNVFVSTLFSDSIYTRRVTIPPSSQGHHANGESWSPSISRDGNYVAFSSFATNLDYMYPDENEVQDIFLNVPPALIFRPSYSLVKDEEANGQSFHPAIADGWRNVTFVSTATNLVNSDANGGVPDIFVWNNHGVINLASINSNGQQANHVSNRPAISADGRFVAFESFATNLDLDRQDTNNKYDIFVHDMQTGKTTRVSINSNGAEGNGDSMMPAISADGSIVAFVSLATNLDPDRPDTNNALDVFVHNRDTGETTRVSVNTSGKGGNAASNMAAISADGRYVAFESDATNLDLARQDSNGVDDIFVHDRVNSETVRITVNSDGQESNAGSHNPTISGDGRYVAFSSSATNLVTGNTNGLAHIFIRDMRPQSTEPYDEPSELGDGTNRLPDASDTQFVLDSGPTAMDQYLFNDQGPIQFYIEVDRVVGRTDDQGYLLEPQELIDKGIVSPKVKLLLSAYDVDSNYSGTDVNPEIDKVYVNGQLVGQLSGSEGNWNVTRLEVDVRHFKFGIPTCPEYDGTNPPAYLSVCSSAPRTAQNEIRIDVDTANNGRVWAVGVDWAAISFQAARPILLVHGRGGSKAGDDACSVPDAGNGCEYWDKNDSFFYFGFRGLLNQAGFLTAHTENFLGQDTPDNHARIIKRVIQQIRVRYGVDRINIVAHSKGGLDSRAYVSNFTLNPDNDVETLIMLATPNHGSYLATMSKHLGWLIDGEYQYNEAMWSLREHRVRDEFNPAHPARAGVRYYSLFAESGTTCIRLKWLWWLGGFFPVPFPCADDLQADALPTDMQRIAAPFIYDILLNNGDFAGRNDFSVTVRSARLLGESGHDETNTYQVGDYPFNHHSIAAALHYPGERDLTIINFIRNSLDIKADTVARLESPLAFDLTEAGLESEGSSLGMENGTVAEGHAFSIPVGIDAVTKTSFVLSWGTGDLYLNLIDPNGRIITPLTADDKLTYTEDRVGDSTDLEYFLPGKTATYSIVEPVMGQWRAQITAADQLPGDQTKWALTIVQDSDITVSLAPGSSWAPLNSPVQLRAEVKEAGTPIAGASVVSTIIRPDDTAQTLTLLDDGAHGDGAASDGVYGNTFVGSQFGIYELSAAATGTRHEIPFTRTTFSQVQVSSGTASISGAFNDRGIDTDGDDLYNELQIDVPIQVTSSGEYSVFGELQSTTGTVVARANASGELTSGQHVLTIGFSGEEIWSNGGNGQFKLTNLTLMDMSTADLPVQIDFKALPYTTKTYDRDEFQHAAIGLTGVTHDYGVDANSNGKFDELVVEVEVSLQTGGNYSWSGRLVDGGGHEFGVYSVDGNFESGLRNLTFRFDGNTIGASHRSGPYYLVDFELWGDGGFISAIDIAQTRAYPFCQFESADPCAPPVSVYDRYDVVKDQPRIVGAPGVLANDMNANGDPRAYYLGDDQHIYQLGWNNGVWNYVDVTQAAGAPPTNGGAMVATTVRDISEPRVYYISPNQHIHELSWSDQNNQWSYRDLKMDAGGPPAAVGSALSVTTVNSLPRVYYLAAQSDGLHIHEYAFGNAGWSHRDVTDETNAPPVAPGNPLSATAITSDDPRVYYLAADRHIHELAWRSLTNVWYHRDVTADGGGLPVAGNVLATTTVDSLPRVYYLSDDQHVHEMNWGVNGWSDIDVTANAGAPPTVAGSALGAATVRDVGEPRVYYLSADQHVRELAWSNQNQMWVDQDLTTRTGGPPAINGSVVSAVAVNLLPHVYYLAADQHVYELSFDSNNEWVYDDLTNITGSPIPDVGSPVAPTAAGGGPLTAMLVDNVVHGRLVFNSNGSFTYTPLSGYTGLDRFTYKANDGFAESAVSTVVLEVTDECAPVSGNLVENFCFARGRAQWRFRTDGQGSFTPSRVNPFAGSASAEVAMSVSGSDTQLYQTGIELQPNTVYELSFAAYSSNGRDMSLWLHEHRPESAGVNYGLKGARVDLTTYWRWYTITFITPNLTDMDNGRLRFWFAPFDAAGTVYHIDRVLLRPVTNP